MEFLTDYVPKSFKNVILSVSFEPNVHFHSVIRANIKNYSDCDAWIAEFGRNTKTKWIVRHTKPEAQRLICRKKYVCHHSDFQKRPNDVHGRKSKNFSCKAFINIRVKLTTSETKKKDKYIRDGLPAIITMNNYHSHDNMSTAAMAYLPPSDEVRSSFESYFNDGLGVREAISIHEAKLQLLGVEDLTDASLNPRYDTVKYWLSNWRKTNLLPEHDEPELDSDQVPGCSVDNDDQDFASCVNDRRNKKTFQELMTLMQNQNDRFGTPQSLLQKAIKRLRTVNTKAGWNAFLNSAGSSLLAHKRNRKSRSDTERQEMLVDNTMKLISVEPVDLMNPDIFGNQKLFVNRKDLSNCIIRIKEEER